MSRFNLSLGRRTTARQIVPSDSQEKLLNFVEFNIKQRELHNFERAMIANMDETSIWADLPSATTIEKKGVSTVPIRTTGHEKNRLTVGHAVKADGTKLKPFVVIPAKKVKKELSSIPGVVVAATSNGWMNGETTSDWLQTVWTKFTFSKQMLVWDSFICHISDAMKEQLKQCNTLMSVIPGGCTKFLQPLDVCINKPSNAFFREPKTLNTPRVGT